MRCARDGAPCRPARHADALLENQRHDVPFLETATHYFVAATITREAQHPLGWVIGDVLVRLSSAAGRARERARRIPFRVENGRRLGRLDHLGLVNHPAVFEQMRSWLARAPLALSDGATRREAEPSAT